MPYKKVLIHGETEGQLDADGRLLEVRTEDGSIIVYQEDEEMGGPVIPMDATETLALIAALTEALRDVLL